jgi:hypothetical protein
MDTPSMPIPVAEVVKMITTTTTTTMMMIKAANDRTSDKDKK